MIIYFFIREIKKNPIFVLKKLVKDLKAAEKPRTLGVRPCRKGLTEVLRLFLFYHK